MSILFSHVGTDGKGMYERLFGLKTPHSTSECFTLSQMFR